MEKTEIGRYFENTSLQYNEILSSIFRELITKYKDETKRQHLIRAAVMLFEKQYPEELERNNKIIKQKRQTRDNEHAANYEQEIRLTFCVPQHIGTLFLSVGQLLKDKTLKLALLSDEAQELYGEQDWFAREFPQYLVPEKY